MTTLQLAEFEQLLEKRLKEVKATREAHRTARVSPSDQPNIESGDWGQALEDEEVEEQIILNDEYYMEKIHKALRRIKLGTYGKCEGCGEVIPMPRLQAKPSVSLCVECQEERELQIQKSAY